MGNQTGGKIHYVKNEQLAEALKKYYIEKKETGEDRPNTKTYQFLGKCFMDIANKLSNSPSFYGYSYKDEMICDAIEVCIKRMDNFSFEVSNNPFAYFTQLCWYAFINRIKLEEKQSDIKSSIILNSGVLDELADMSMADENFDKMGITQYILDNIKEPKKKLEKGKKRTTLAHQKRLKEQEKENVDK